MEDKKVGPLVTLATQEIIAVCEAPLDESKGVVIGGRVNYSLQEITLYRMDGPPINAPFSMFKPSGTTSPDFDQLELVDYGYTIKLGEYEASSSAILYELDPEYKAFCDANRMTE